MKRRSVKVGVLLGGPSSEREISIRSGTAVCDALASAGFDLVRIDPKDTTAVKENITEAGIDVAFIALHGSFGEDGAIQSILEEMKIPYTGSGPQASRLALNKVLSKKIFQDRGIPTPAYSVLERPNKPRSLVRDMGLPFVVKPASEGSSIGLSIVESPDQVDKALDEAFSYDREIILEKYIKGQDITVGILNEYPLPVIGIMPKEKFYSYHAKYTQGMTEYIIPADITQDLAQEAQQISLMAHQALGCRSFSRVDMILGDDGRISVLEVNTIPGLTNTSLLPKAAQAAGIDFIELCTTMVESALVIV